ncbi:hypothetical protein [Variovorax sp. KK3]|uniref:hypothetical protein n=1 Tax=Variovorax sp. KK3 TaxID=1855728 RepID=UPI0009F8FA07|nr:hypothetical protein [Variovorax sp. KK3]
MTTGRQLAWVPRQSLLLLSLLALGGCQFHGTVPPFSAEGLPPPAFTDAPGRCTSARIRFALGQQVSRPLLEEMRLRAGARRAMALAPTDEHVPYDSLRLIVDIENNGRVVAARCG